MDFELVDEYSQVAAMETMMYTDLRCHRKASALVGKWKFHAARWMPEKLNCTKRTIKMPLKPSSPNSSSHILSMNRLSG